MVLSLVLIGVCSGHYTGHVTGRQLTEINDEEMANNLQTWLRDLPRYDFQFQKISNEFDPTDVDYYEVSSKKIMQFKFEKQLTNPSNSVFDLDGCSLCGYWRSLPSWGDFVLLWGSLLFELLPQTFLWLLQIFSMGALNRPCYSPIVSLVSPTPRDR